MKHSRLLITVLFILLLPLSWYKMYSDSSSEEAMYQAYLADARNKASLQLVKGASESYMRALEIYDSCEIQLETAKMYYDNKKYNIFEDLCDSIVQKYPKELAAYELLAQYYYMLESYEDIIAIQDNLSKRNLSSKIVNELCQSIEYQFTYSGSYTFSEISNFYAGYARVRNSDGFLGYYNTSGNVVIACMYVDGSMIRESGLAGITTSSNEAYIIDWLNDKVNCDPQERNITKIGTISDNVFPVMMDGKYYASDYSFQLSEDSYDYIGGFADGLAAAKLGNEWFFINANGQRISNKSYADIVLDDGEIAFHHTRAMVKVKDSYMLIDSNENQIGSLVFEDGINFIQENQPACIQLDGKWGFINEAGEVVIEPQYENARPFSNGLAGVIVEGGWNYIDITGEIRILGPFQEVRELSDIGSAFVKSDDVWRLIRLYDSNLSW